MSQDIHIRQFSLRQDEHRILFSTETYRLSLRFAVKYGPDSYFLRRRDPGSLARYRNQSLPGPLLI